MRIFITGIAGFVASNVANKLYELGHEIYGVDNLKFGYIQNINPEIEWAVADMSDLYGYDSLVANINEFDVLLHMACDNIIYSQNDPIETFKTNALKSIQLIQTFNGKVVYTSTASVYGQADFVPIVEDSEIRVYNAYDQSKYITELFLKQRGNYTTLRLSNVYGANQRPDNPCAGVVAKIINSVRHNKEVIIYGDGGDTRDYTYIDDTVNAIIKACEMIPMNTEINIGTGEETSVNALVNQVSLQLHKQVYYVYLEGRSIDKIQRRSLDNLRAEELLGWNHTVDITEGIKRTIDWQTKNYTL